VIYDALTGEYVNAVKAGLLDSTPAVLEAIRNSLSIASLLGPWARASPSSATPTWSATRQSRRTTSCATRT
jgi:hypothetical protein